MKVRPLPWITGLITLVLLSGLTYRLRSVFLPLGISLVLAYLLDPVADRLERRMQRSSAVILVFTLFLLLGSGSVLFLSGALQREFSSLARTLPSYAAGLSSLIPDWLHPSLGLATPADWEAFLRRGFAGLQGISLDMVEGVLFFVSDAFGSTLSFLLAVLGYGIIPLYLFYLLRDFDRFRLQLLDLVPIPLQPGVGRLALRIDGVLSAYVRGQLMICLILGCWYSAGLALVGVDMALVVGIGSGIGFLLPYVGTLIGGGVALLLALIKFQDLLHPFWVILLFCGGQLLEGMFLTPRLVGDRVGLHPLTAILALLIAGELAGLPGLLVGIPVAAIGKILAGDLVGRYKSSAVYLNGTNPPEELSDGEN